MPDLNSHTVAHTSIQLRAPTIVGVLRDINRHEEATNRGSSIKDADNKLCPHMQISWTILYEFQTTMATLEVH